MTAKPELSPDSSNEEAHIAFVVRDAIREFLKKERPLHFVAIVVGVLFGVGGVALELWLHNQFQAQRDSIKDIVSNVSTVYLPDWPDNVYELSALIHRAVENGDDLEIQIPFFGYLRFTRPAEYKILRTELLTVAAKGGKITILTLDYANAKNDYNLQFGKEKDNDFTKLDPSLIENYVEMNRPAIERTDFGRKYRKGYKPTESDRNEFIESMLLVDNDFCSTLTSHDNITVKTTSADLFLDGPYFWLRHTNGALKEMVFAYPKFRGTRKGYAFRTQDGHLMEVYRNQFSSISKEAKPIAKASPLFPEIANK